ncbi:hypothetical protein ABZU45_37570 [Streptomyces avermitilis]|uniref:hypothetical protein n=1 Tax=Streptomyces avermitilis TaxID=33903 RepID=UPI0033A10929
MSVLALLVVLLLVLVVLLIVGAVVYAVHRCPSLNGRLPPASPRWLRWPPSLLW